MPATTSKTKFDQIVDLPARKEMNSGLTAASEKTMLAVLGVPGRLTYDCSDPTGAYAKHILWNANIGPFKVSGLDSAIGSLRDIFAEVKATDADLYGQVKKDGMLCVRHRRSNPQSFSNHSWGAAIDLYFGKDVVEQGRRATHLGNLLLAPYFNRHGWYWGAGFSGKSVDSMHFELAEETVLKIKL